MGLLTGSVPVGLSAADSQSPTPMLMAVGPSSGSQVWINGERLPLLWQWRAERLAIADYGITRDLGLELLSTTDASWQPVRWFSDPLQRPLRLPSRIEGGYRFLDITDIAQQAGWQIEVAGSDLRLTLPVVSIQNIRRGRQTWGDRIVVDLAAPATWGLRESPGEFTLTLDASMAAGDASNDPTAALAAEAGNLLRRLSVTRTPQQIIIRGTIDDTARPVVTTLPAPNRLLIDIRQDYLLPQTIQWASGMRWQQQYISVAGRSFPVYWLDVSPSQSGLSFRPIWSDPTTATGISPLVTTAQRWQAAAAINAGFFNRNNRYPLGAIRRDGRWISGPILSRGAVGWNDAGQTVIDRLVLQQTLATEGGQVFPLQVVNSGYVKAGISLYTPEWGPTYVPLTDAETLVSVVNDRVVAQRFIAAVGGEAVTIPAEGYVLAVRSQNSALSSLAPNIQLTLQSQSLPASFDAYPHILGGGPLLLKNGQTVLNAAAESFSTNFATQAAPRSALGISSQGSWLLAAIHYSPGGRGPTLSETAEVMRQLGARDALNLDGGSSASLYLGGRLLNRDSATAARIHNALGLFFTS